MNEPALDDVRDLHQVIEFDEESMSCARDSRVYRRAGKQPEGR